jgi:hypothetical protein
MKGQRKMKIESLDVLKAKQQLDLQEQTRRDDAYVQLNKLIDGLSEVNAFPPLVWLWTWDMVKDRLDMYTQTEDSREEYVTNSNLTEKDVFDLFWEDADKNAFSLEYGLEELDDAILDWMISRDIIIMIEEEDYVD